MLENIKIKLQYLLPKKGLTRLAGWFAERRFGWLTQLIIRAFIKIYKIDMSEAKRQSPSEYVTFNDFFTRELKEGARPINEDSFILTFPADGTISQFGHIQQTTLIQAKDHVFSLDSLLACNSQMVSTFQNGLFVTTYLSPRDYHRVHMPCDGVLQETLYVPGELFSVSQFTAENIPNLYARNERLICLFATPFGPMIQIMVGATLVGSIVTSWDGTVTPSHSGIIQRKEYPSASKNMVKLNKGDEMGRFKLGSTVITLFTQNSVTLSAQLKKNSKTHVGQSFATAINHNQTNDNSSAN